MEPKVRSWFLRNALDALERVHGFGTREKIRYAVPPRLSHLIEPERVRATPLQETILLEDAEDVLFAADSVVGLGAATSMESVALQAVSRAMADGAASVCSGDLAGTVSQLRCVFESPFVDTPFSFELSRTDEGFTVLLGVSGRPRAARLMRHFAVGAVRAAARYAREPGTSDLRVSGESMADRALINVTRSDGEAGKASSTARSRPASRTSSPPARLTDEVARILNSARDTTPPPASERPNTTPPRRDSTRPGRQS